MQQFELGARRRRSPLAAGILGLLAPGLGLLYCGKVREAFVSLAAAIAPWLICAVSGNPTLKISMVIIHFLIYALQLGWGVVVAWRLGEDYELARYNRGLIYVLVFMLFAAYNEMDSAYLTQVLPLATNSMSPTLDAHDVVMLSKAAYRLGDPEPGDAVVFRHRAASRMPFVGRIVAGPDDRVELRDGRYLVNDELLVGQPLFKPELLLATSSALTNTPPLKLAADHYFIVGDNQSSSYDSRFCGPVARELLLGRLDAILITGAGTGPRWGQKP
jgi:signal peptidase I